MAYRSFHKSYNANGDELDPSHIVRGTGAGVGTTTVVTLVGRAIFKSATSYQVVVTDESATTPVVSVAYTSGSSFTITHTTGHVVRWIAIGQ